MIWIQLLLWLALARPPHQGDLDCRALSTQENGAPALIFTLQSHSPEMLSLVLPAGTPMSNARGNTVYLFSQVNAQIKPGQRLDLRIPVVVRSDFHEGEYEPSEDFSLNCCAMRVRQVVQQGGDVATARLALLPPEDLTADQKVALSRFQLTAWRMLTPLDVRGRPIYHLDLKTNELQLDLPEIHCPKPAFWTSGTLKITIWASRREGVQDNQVVDGFRLGEFTLQRLNGGGTWPAITLKCPLRRPPAGLYYTTFTIEEYSPTGWFITLWASYPGQVRL